MSKSSADDLRAYLKTKRFQRVVRIERDDSHGRIGTTDSLGRKRSQSLQTQATIER